MACVDLCGMWGVGSEGELDITGVWGTGRSGSPRWEAPATATHTLRPVLL